MEVVQASFSARNLLKPNFHNCTCCAMLVDSCFSAGKIRLSRFYCCVGCTGVFECQKCPNAQFPQL